MLKCQHFSIYKKHGKLYAQLSMKKYFYHYNVASESEITSCNKIDKPLVVYRFSGHVITLQETRSIHDSMNLPKLEFIS